MSKLKLLLFIRLHKCQDICATFIAVNIYDSKCLKVVNIRQNWSITPSCVTHATKHDVTHLCPCLLQVVYVDKDRK